MAGKSLALHRRYLCHPATFVPRDEVFRQTVRYSLQGGALFVVFSYILSRRSVLLSRLLASAPVVWVGLVSYTLYLCHMAIYAAVQTTLQVGPIMAGVIGAPLAFAYAYLMREFVEVPILRWRRRHRAEVSSPGEEPILNVSEDLREVGRPSQAGHKHSPALDQSPSSVGGTGP